MSALSLKERLQLIQCHFTWEFMAHDNLDIGHILQTLTVRIKHTPYNNQATFYAMQAYVCQRAGQYQDAFQSLGNAVKALKENHQVSDSCSMLVTYGNYAWLYYYLSDYDMVEQFLGKINDISRPLSHPAPTVALVPEINGAKGWSLLILGSRNAEQTIICFEEALSADPDNREFRAGLAIAVFARDKRYDSGSEQNEEAKAKLREIVHDAPINYEVKVCLAHLLKWSDMNQAKELAEDAMQHSCNPEVWRNAAHVFKTTDLPRFQDILQQAIKLDPSYYLLYRDIGYLYLKELTGANAVINPDIISAGIQAYKTVIELVPLCVWGKIGLAELYGINEQQRLQQEMYSNLESELPTLSPECQQAFFLNYGKFLLYKMNSLDDAANMFEQGFQISSGTWNGKQCRLKLTKVANFFQKQGRLVEANNILHLIQEGQNP